MNNIREMTIRSGFAKACGQAANLVIRTFSMMILGRLLDPADFGLIGMVAVATGVFNLLKDAGLSSATVQKATVTEEQVSTLFWINILLGVMFTILTMASAPLLVVFYKDQRLFWVTMTMAAGFLFNSVGVQHTALLQRRMQFVALTIIETICILITTIVAICMAIAGFSYWALVVSSILSPAIYSICVWRSANWVPGAPSRGIGIHSMLRFGGTVTLNSLVTYCAYNVEKVLLGRFWGADALGIYGKSLDLATMPTDNITLITREIGFSALSRIQDDSERIRSFFLKGYSLVLTMTFPITLSCALFAEDMILVLLGGKWIAAVPIFRLLSLLSLVFGIINPFGWLLKSTGLQVRSLKIALVIAPIAIASYIIGLPYGPKGVAFAYSTAMILWMVPHILWCIRGTPISPYDILTAISRPFLSTIVAGIAAIGFQYLSGGLHSSLLELLLGGGVMFAVYIWMIFFVMGQKEVYMDLLRALRKPSSHDMKKSVGSIT